MMDANLGHIILILIGGLTLPLALVIWLYMLRDWRRYVVPVVIGVLSVGFIAWAAFFIHQSSILALDGLRYYALYDDAMISMRYAWNFAHGHGLVWNPGEYVEGYTSLLMILIMAAPMLVFNRIASVLAVQIMGIVFALGSAWLLRLIAGQISQGYPPGHRALLKTLAFAWGLLYFPLVYWPLVGGDLGPVMLFMLLGVLAAFKSVDTRRRVWLYVLPAALGLSYLARPDALIPAVVILIYAAVELRDTRKMLAITGMYLLFPLGQTLFRLAYYGTLVPNTYTLKVTGVPLADRLHDGLAFMQPYFHSLGWVILLVIISLVFRFRKRKLMAVMIALGLIAYQIWIGGDMVIHYGRLISPMMPLILLFFTDETIRFLRFVCGRIGVGWLYGPAVIVVMAAAFYFLNYLPLTGDVFVHGPMNRVFTGNHVAMAVAIDRVTTPEATIGVTAAGIVPYYTGRVAVDFLGKSDSHIAQLPPRLGSYSQGGMINYPGHIKYDLHYSIVERRPDYVETYTWGAQDVSDWAQDVYVTVTFRGVPLRLLSGSPEVYWNWLCALGSLVPEHPLCQVNRTLNKGGSPSIIQPHMLL